MRIFFLILFSTIIYLFVKWIHLKVLLIIAAILAFTIVSIASIRHVLFSKNASVSYVVDGDTLKTKAGETIRLYGIDCPEIDQPFGLDARNFVAQAVHNKRVRLQYKKGRSYGRRIAVVYCNGLNINLELLRRGYAWIDYRYYKESYDDPWVDAVVDARMHRRGLWQMKDPVPPWKHRAR